MKQPKPLVKAMRLLGLMVFEESMGARKLLYDEAMECIDKYLEEEKQHLADLKKLFEHE